MILTHPSLRTDHWISPGPPGPPGPGTSSAASSSSFPMIFPEEPITTVTSQPRRWKD